MFYKNLESLYKSGIFLGSGDTFQAAGHMHTVVLGSINSYMQLGDGYGRNADSLLALGGLGYRDKLRRIYGYEPGHGQWPEWRANDYAAAKNVAMWIMALDEAKFMHNSQIEVGDTVFLTFSLPPFQTPKDTLGLHTAGTVLSWDSSCARVHFESGNDFWVSPQEIIKVNFSLTNKTSTDEHLQKSPFSDKGEERSTGTGVSGRGSAAAIGCGPAGVSQIVEDSNPKIRQGQVRGSVLKF